MALMIPFLCFGLILESHNKKPVLDLATAQRASQEQTETLRHRRRSGSRMRRSNAADGPVRFRRRPVPALRRAYDTPGVILFDGMQLVTGKRRRVTRPRIVPKKTPRPTLRPRGFLSGLNKVPKLRLLDSKRFPRGRDGSYPRAEQPSRLNMPDDQKTFLVIIRKMDSAGDRVFYGLRVSRYALP
jgi:hypothetical protein